jgi:hypothetical protein
MVVKFIIFKLKTIHINIYIFKLFYNLNLKSMFNQTYYYFLFNLNSNYSFNQTYINIKPISIKNIFL